MCRQFFPTRRARSRSHSAARATVSVVSSTQTFRCVASTPSQGSSTKGEDVITPLCIYTHERIFYLFFFNFVFTACFCAGYLSTYTLRPLRTSGLKIFHEYKTFFLCCDLRGYQITLIVCQTAVGDTLPSWVYTQEYFVRRVQDSSSRPRWQTTRARQRSRFFSHSRVSNLGAPLTCGRRSF